MVVDASVLLQILFREQGAAEATLALLEAYDPLIATPSLLETEIVYGARRGFGTTAVDELIHRLGIRSQDFGQVHLSAAKLAYQRFGKGQGHPAQLNFGDCISYAVAKVEQRTLAFTGEVFVHTDLPLVRLG